MSWTDYVPGAGRVREWIKGRQDAVAEPVRVVPPVRSSVPEVPLRRHVQRAADTASQSHADYWKPAASVDVPKETAVVRKGLRL